MSANDNQWHHICVSWENAGGSMNFYKDGVLLANATSFRTGHVIRAGGSLMLGQEQDSFAGRLDSSQAFQGFLTDLNVWDYVVCQEIISRMSKACSSGKGNVYEWSNGKHGLVGRPRVFIPSPCSPPAAVPGKRISFEMTLSNMYNLVDRQVELQFYNKRVLLDSDYSPNSYIIVKCSNENVTRKCNFA